MAGDSDHETNGMERKSATSFKGRALADQGTSRRSWIWRSLAFPGAERLMEASESGVTVNATP